MAAPAVVLPGATGDGEVRTSGHVPPNDTKAEIAVLGSIVLDNSALSVVALQPEDFFRTEHQVIYAAMLSLAKRGEPIDTLTLCNELMASSRLEKAAGANYVCGLTEQVPSAVNAAAYAKIVRELADVRRIIHNAAEIARQGYEPGVSAAALAAAWQKAASQPTSTGAKRIGELCDGAFAMFARRSRGEEKPVPVPWRGLATALRGGLWPGLYCLVGGTGRGKTQFALQIAYAAASAGIPTSCVNLELDGAQLVARVCGLIANVSWSDLYVGAINEGDERWQRAADAAIAIHKIPLTLEEAGPFGWHYREIHRVAQAIRRQHPAPAPALIVIDYLQLVDGDEEEIRLRTKSAAYAARWVAKELGCAIVIVSGTSRSNYAVVEGADRPEIGQVIGAAKESGDVEFALDGLLVLVGGRESEDVNLAVAKIRTGPSAWVPLKFDGNRFTEEAVWAQG